MTKNNYYENKNYPINFNVATNYDWIGTTRKI